MNPEKYHLLKIAESTAEVTQRGERNMMEVKVAGRDICVIHHKESLYACTAKCPHAGGQLSKGFVDANGNIVCPLHRYRFSLKNGVNSSGEGYHLKTFRIEENDDGVFIRVEKASF